MKRRLKFWICLPAAVLAFALSGCVTEDAPVLEERVAVGDRLPDFSVVMNDGETITPQALLGEPAVIVLFSTACGDCRRELPRLQGVYESHPDLRIICISRSEGAESLSEYWKAHALTLPWSAQPDDAVFRLFASGGIPRVYVVNSAGYVVHIFVESLPEDFDSYFS